MTTISLTDARKNLSNIVAKANRNGEEFSITVNGEVVVTILSNEDYESLLETIEILQDQKVLRDIARAQKEYSKGNVVHLKDL